jgi:hypothetical protein
VQTLHSSPYHLLRVPVLNHMQIARVGGGGALTVQFGLVALAMVNASGKRWGRRGGQ